MSLTFGAMDVAASIANFLRTSRPEGEHENSPGRGPRRAVVARWGGGQSVAAAWVDIEKM